MEAEGLAQDRLTDLRWLALKVHPQHPAAVGEGRRHVFGSEVEARLPACGPIECSNHDVTLK
jgi:hypothetical protein